jgi:transposase
MPRRYPPELRRQVVELARSGTKVRQLVATFAISEATIYNWLRKEQLDRGEISGASTDMALDLTAAKRRIRQLETELAVSRRLNDVFLERGLPPKGSSR